MKNIMRTLITAFILMSSSILPAQDGKAVTEKNTFNRTTSVSTTINSAPAKIWSLLTTAANYPKWNSTVVFIKGNIAEEEKIELKSTLDTTRTFKLKIKEYVPNEKLVWGDGKGVRSYTLEKNEKGGVTFSMTETIGGLMFPMYAKYIPDFDESFEKFAADLKRASEK